MDAAAIRSRTNETVSFRPIVFRDTPAGHPPKPRHRVCVVDALDNRRHGRLVDHLQETLAEADCDVVVFDPAHHADFRNGSSLWNGSGPASLIGSPTLQHSYLAYERLRQEAFDTILFRDQGGIAFYSVLAKRQGLAFSRTSLGVIGTGASQRWRQEVGKLLRQPEDIEREEIERRSAAWADAFWCLNEEIAEWCSDHCWPIPTVLGPLDLAAHGTSPPTGPAEQWRAVERLAAAEAPLVSVCLVHHNRPYLLGQAIRSLENQDYPKLEVILVDDGSTHPMAARVLDLWEPRFQQRGWRILREPNRYLGAARNRAAAAATGEYLLFMDDDNVAKPHEISTFVRVAQHTHADLLFSLFDRFTGTKNPTATTRYDRHLLPGIKSPLGLVRNCFGDANAMIRRERFWEMGGFTEDVGIMHEDWELFSKSALAGLRMEMIPEALFWYRVHPNSMTHSVHRERSLRRSLRPYLPLVPTFFRPYLEYSVGQMVAYENTKAELDRLRGQMKLLRKHTRQLEYQLARRNLHLSQARYVWADRLNDGLKRFSMVHRLVRRWLGRRSPSDASRD